MYYIIFANLCRVVICSVNAVVSRDGRCYYMLIHLRCSFPVIWCWVTPWPSVVPCVNAATPCRGEQHGSAEVSNKLGLQTCVLANGWFGGTAVSASLHGARF